MKEIISVIMRVTFGQRTIDSALDWKDARTKAGASRAEVDRIIKESENSQVE